MRGWRGVSHAGRRDHPLRFQGVDAAAIRDGQLTVRLDGEHRHAGADFHLPGARQYLIDIGGAEHRPVKRLQPEGGMPTVSRHAARLLLPFQSTTSSIPACRSAVAAAILAGPAPTIAT